jgi:parallel beta-helix repeat protein
MKVSAPLALDPQHYTKDFVETLCRQGAFEAAAENCLIEISDDGVVLDLRGAVLDGEDFTGSGIHVHDCSGVTIKNGIIKGFYYGIRASDAADLTIENCVVSDNYNPRDRGWLTDTIDPVEEGFGGGVYLIRVTDSLIKANQLSNNFDGLCLVRSDRNRILENDASYNSNVGIHLVKSAHNLIEGNRADHCVRYTGRFWCDTADSAGILLEEYSHHNRIFSNRMRYSGDGFFIRANNRHGSNHNYVARNDASFSPNNAFEAGFSEDNAFEENIASYSNYGFWLGYSSGNVLRGNLMQSNRFDGVAMEGGSRNTLESNKLDGNRSGIRLWEKAAQWESQEQGPYGGHKISGNEVKNSRETGILYPGHWDVLLEQNDFDNNQEDVRRGPPEPRLETG